MADEPQGSPPPGGWLPPDETVGGPVPGGGAPPPGGPPPGPPPQQPPAWGQPQYPQQPQQPQWGQYGQQQQNPYGQPTPWASTYYWKQAEPDNTPAVTGFIMSLASLGTLVMFFGLLSPINLCVSIAAVFVSRTGIRKVDQGETKKNRDLATWGFWLGIVGAVLSALAIAAFVALIASSPDWVDDLDTSEPR